MDTVFTQEALETVFDPTIREVPEKAAGIRLYRGTDPPAGDVCTVLAIFETGFHSSISLCGETAAFIRLTQNMMGRQEVTPRDVEDFTKEYFNIFCGRIAAALFRPTRIASRFGVPSFYQGRCRPEGKQEQFVLTYYGDQEERLQLAHLITGAP